MNLSKYFSEESFIYKYRKIIVGGIILLLILIFAGKFFYGKKEIVSLSQSKKKTIEKTKLFQWEEGMSPISALKCDNWQRRPLAIMYSGDLDARRNFRGLSQADFVLEMDHRPMHGQPRVMGIYQCATLEAMGPMRSGRTDHISVAGSLDAIYVPWGGSSVGKNLLKKHVIDHIDCNGEVAPIGYAPACRKDSSLLVSPLHSAGPAFSNLAELIKIAQANHYRLTTNLQPLPHQNDLPREQRPSYGKIIVKAPYPYRIIYRYDPETNTYKRFLQKKENSVPKVDIDQNNKKQYAPKNVIVIIAKKEAWRTDIDYKAQGLQDPWEGVDEGHRQRDNGQYPNFQLGDPWFDKVFEGPARIFLNGQNIHGTWKKEKGLDKPFRFYDEKGELVKFVPGQIWMHVLAHDRTVAYNASKDEK